MTSGGASGLAPTGGAGTAEQRSQLRRAVIASTVGTSIEWYDFFLYGTMAGLVFPKLFFPNASPTAGVLESFATFFVGFIARPIGAAIFGHYGDRIGRKAMLIATLLTMGIGTFLIGVMPGYTRESFGNCLLDAVPGARGFGE
ncbi:MAG: MFS transporter, partial [Streptosporangiaceae bacterium]